MKLIRKIGIVIATAVAVLCCGCGNSDTASKNNTPSVEKAQSKSPDVAFTVPQTISESDSSNEITYFGNQDISAVAELFEKNTGCTVNVEKSESDYINVLSEKISSDDSPDLCDKVDNTFPYLISMNFYEDLTDYIDITSPQWSDYTDIIDYYSFKGGKFFYPTTVKVMPQFLIYVKTTYVQCGNVPDPEKLWLMDEWTWNTFKQGANSVIGCPMSSADALLCGRDIFDNFLATSGEPIFPRNGNVFSNGLETWNAQCVSELLSTQKIKHTDEFDADTEMPYFVFLSGDEQTLAELRKTDLSVGAVPYPRYEDADKYYCKAVSEGFLVPKGAKNIKSAASFINCSRIVDASDEQREKNEQKLMDSGLLLSDVEWLESIRSSDKMTPILVEDNCFDDSTNTAVQKITEFTYIDSWNELSEECFPVIDRALEKINAVTE